MEQRPLFYIVISIAAYLLGGFPTGVVLTRRKFGLDVRELGSGNIGATNVTRVFGWYAGFLVFLIDFLKGALPLLFLTKIYPEDRWLLTVAASALVLGHCFSVYLLLKGGKGVATSLGCIAVVAPWCALASAGVYVVMLAATKISAIGSLGGICACVVYLAVANPPQPIRYLIVGISFVVLVRHRQNINRLLKTFIERQK